jgi:flagellar L-ring protein precursor FlgH
MLKYFSCVSKGLVTVGLVAFISGCTVTPTTITQKPVDGVSLTQIPRDAHPGSIYNANGYRPMFEDRKSRWIGDTVTITITENTNASKNDSGSSSMKNSVGSNINLRNNGKPPLVNLSSSSNSAYNDSAAAKASNSFVGNITATVVDVKPNGYLVVHGEKKIAFDQGTEFVRFSGVVNPDMITAGNNVLSSTIADARIEYRTNSNIDSAQVVNSLSRFFLSFIPI